MANPTDNAPGSNLKAGGQPSDTPPTPYVPIAPPNLVTFNRDKITPPSPLYIQRDDLIGIQFATSVASEIITLSGRLLRAADGVIVPFSLTVASAGTYSSQVKTFNMGEGFLLAISALPTVATRRGQTFANCFLVRGSASNSPLVGVQQVLFSDYVTGNQPTGWPGGRIVSSLEGFGRNNVAAPSNPGAGSDFILTSQNKAFQRLAMLKCKFVASATVANRQVVFQVFGTTVINIGAPANITAGQTIFFNLGIGVSQYTGADGSFYLPLPGQQMAAGDGVTNLVASVTTGIQAGDQWSNIAIGWEEFLNVG